ncbi:cytoplasmic protein [Paenibacillus sp. Marseille-Q4541]|uniref:cytoplasmic protein n=1 Tax=Paenibacillus sp. Marseille-Q4541 TaxID=2831522 RepID=UPI001BA569A4|nr:cytoplasmic protein [Paenibacillus sp. Marseille-Q4541]
MMNEQTRHDLNISGVGKSAGGVYRHVRVDGVGKFSSDMDCVSYEVNGNSGLQGNLRCERYVVNGAASVQGNMIAEEYQVNGSSKIEGGADTKQTRIDGICTIRENLETDKLIVNGKATVDGKLIASHVEIAGGITIGKDVECETIEVQGGFKIKGMLNAGTVDIMLHHRCEVEEIGGEQIQVRRKSRVRLLDQFVPAMTPRLKTKIIEGDDIYLEHTHAETVRGSRISIGPGCEIGVVEYSVSYEQDPESEVRQHIHV